MPADSRIVALYQNLVATLANMSRAEGYAYDYGEIVEDSDPAFDASKNAKGRPDVFVNWRGEVDQDAIAGGEMATARIRHFSLFSVTVPIIDEDGKHTAKAWAVETDIHAALMAGSSRARGTGGRATTYHQATHWEGGSSGGMLELVFTVRWDHKSGDMTTE